MNTIVGAIPGYSAETLLTRSPFGELKIMLSNKHFLLVMGLLGMIFISALAVVYEKAESRLAFAQLNSLQQQDNALHIKWGQLVLEKSTWVSEARLQQNAARQLHMLLPAQKNIIIIKQ